MYLTGSIIFLDKFALCTYVGQLTCLFVNSFTSEEECMSTRIELILTLPRLQMVMIPPEG